MAIKGLHVVKKRVASGVSRFYYYAYRGGPKFWSTDKTRIDSPGKRLPPEFIEAYHQAIENERLPTKGTLADAIRLYRERSPKFKKMKPKGQLARLKYLQQWEDMPLAKGRRAASAPLSVFDSRKIIRYITSYRDVVWGHSASAADEAVIALSALLTWCIKDGRLDWNRTHGIEPLYERPTEARIWSDEEQALFLSRASWHLSVAFRLLLFTGLRREDLTTLQRSARKGQHLLVPTGKSRGRQT
ncbi:MAG: hypothetical protein AAFQ84_04835, partial [Pseudomonadota bacterium]